MPAELLNVSAVGFLYFMASTTIKVLLPLYLTTLGVPITQIGFVVGAQALLPVFLSVPAGALADRIGFRQMTILGAAGMCIASGLYYLSGSVPVLVLAQLIMGIAELAVWLSAQAIATQIGTGAQRGRAVGFFGFAIAFGQAVAPTIAGFTADAIGYKQALLLSLCFSGGTLLAGVLLSRVKGTVPAGLSLMDQFKAAGELSRSPRIQAGLLCTFTMIVTRTVRSSFFPVYLKQIGFSASLIGLLVSTMELSSTCVRVFLGRLMQVVSAERMLVAGMFLGIVATVITPLIPYFPLLALASVAAGLGLGINLPLTMVIISDEAPKHLKGVAVGIRLTGNRFAQLVSPIMFSVLGRWFALGPSFYVAGGVLLLGNVLTAVLLRKPGSKVEAQAGD